MKSVGLILPLVLSATAHAEWTRLPAKFECDRIYAKIPVGTQEQYFFTDSGGGLNPFTYKEIVTAWGVDLPEFQVMDEEGMKAYLGKLDWPKSVSWPFFPKKSDAISLTVVDCSKESKNEYCELRDLVKDGFLGANWYSDTVWILDYTKREVFYSSKMEHLPKSSALPLGFKTASGKRKTHQPRMQIEIDGQSHGMLFDTGATSYFSEEAQTAMKLESPLCASNFIRRSVFDQLSKKHRDWKVIKAGDRYSGGGDLIEVPRIKIGEHEVGPVWFAARNDSIYDHYSKEIMDDNIDGAIGGNTFKHFKVTIDYPGSKLYLEK